MNGLTPGPRAMVEVKLLVTCSALHGKMIIFLSESYLHISTTQPSH